MKVVLKFIESLTKSKCHASSCLSLLTVGCKIYVCHLQHGVDVCWYTIEVELSVLYIDECQRDCCHCLCI